MKGIKDHWIDIVLIVSFTYLGGRTGLFMGLIVCLIGYVFEKIIERG